MRHELDLHKLNSFLHVVDLESVSKAAAILNVAQPAISRQIRQLEEELGVALLIRHGRGVLPSPAGKFLAEQARGLLHAARSLRDTVRTFEAEPSGKLSFGVPSSFGRVMLPALGIEFRANYPKIQLHLAEGFSGSIHEWILAGRLDLAVLYQTPNVGHLSVMPLLEEAVVVVGPPGVFAVDENLAPSRLAALPLVLPSRPHRLRMLIDEISAAMRKVEPVLEIDALSALLEIVRSGGMYTVLPYSAVASMTERNEVSVAKLASKHATRRLFLARQSSRPPNSATLALERSVVRLVGEHAERLRWRPIWKG